MPANPSASWGRIAIPCAHCGEHFWVYPSKSTRTYCSQACHRAATARPKVRRVCQRCEAVFYVYPSYLKYGGALFCSRACMHRGRRMTGADHWNWQGGRQLKPDGYYRVWVGANQRRPEHQLVWEAANGRPVPPGHEVHHVDGNPRNNHPENLLLIRSGDHQRLHAAAQRQAGGGRWAVRRGWEQCQDCGTTARKHLARGYCGACYQRRFSHAHSGAPSPRP